MTHVITLFRFCLRPKDIPNSGIGVSDKGILHWWLRKIFRMPQQLLCLEVQRPKIQQSWWELTWHKTASRHRRSPFVITGTQTVHSRRRFINIASDFSNILPWAIQRGKKRVERRERVEKREHHRRGSGQITTAQQVTNLERGQEVIRPRTTMPGAGRKPNVPNRPRTTTRGTILQPLELL